MNGFVIGGVRNSLHSSAVFYALGGGRGDSGPCFVKVSNESLYSTAVQFLLLVSDILNIFLTAGKNYIL
jgi:hypothetical protein